MYGIAIHAKERVYWEECLLLRVVVGSYLALRCFEITRRSRTAEARIDRLAAMLPPSDADKLRARSRRRGLSPPRPRADTYDRALEQAKTALSLRVSVANARSARPSIRYSRRSSRQVPRKCRPQGAASSPSPIPCGGKLAPMSLTMLPSRLRCSPHALAYPYLPPW